MVIRLFFIAISSIGLIACEDDPPPLKLTVSPIETAMLGYPSSLTVEASSSLDHIEWRVIEQPLEGRMMSDPLLVRDLDPREPTKAQASLTPHSLGQYVISVLAKSGKRSATETIELEVSCTPPRWTVDLHLDDPELPLLVGSSIPISAELNQVSEDGCPSVDAPPYQVEWSLRSWPSQTTGEAVSQAIQVINDEHVRLHAESRGEHLIYHKLTDSLGRRAESTLNINVSCGALPPVATAEVLEGVSETPGEAPLDITVGRAVIVSLSGQDPDQSCDPHETLHYAWSWDERPAGSIAVLNDRETGRADFIPDRPGLYALSAIVTDSSGLSDETRLTFLAGECGTRAPQISSVVAAPSAFELGEATTLSLAWEDLDLTDDCLGTEDSGYSIEWSVISAPPQSVASPSPIDGGSPTFTPDQEGSYTLGVTLTDPSGLQASASVELETIRCTLRPLLLSASASSEQIFQGEHITLSASAQLDDSFEACSLEDDRSSLEVNYRWRSLSLPPGAAPLITNDRPSVSFQTSVAGQYLFEVSAQDRQGRETSPVRVAVTVEACGSTPPQIDQISHEGSLAIGEILRFSAVVSDRDSACLAQQSLSYHWSVLSRPLESLARFDQQNAQRSRPHFEIDRSGDYLVQLILTDETGLESTSQYAFNVAPCGEGQPTLTLSASEENPLMGQWVTLSARAEDPDSAIGCDRIPSFTYTWLAESLPVGYESSLRLDGPHTQVFIEQSGLYRFSVDVTDNTGRRSNRQSIELLAQDCGGRALVVDAITPSPLNPQLGQAIRLEATLSDPDAECGLDLSTSATLTWHLVSRPQGSEAVLSASNTPSFIPDRPGEYLVQASALSSDGLLSIPLQRSIEVSACGGFPPSITALDASATSVRVGEVVHLNVSSDDLDRIAPCGLTDQHQAQWRLLSAPAGSQAQLSGQRTHELTMIPDLEGLYELEVVVSDERGFSDRARQQITANRCGQSIPILEALSVDEESIFLGDTVTLSGQASPPDAHCEPNSSLTWHWRILSRPHMSQATLSSVNAERPTFTPDISGEYRFEAVVASASNLLSNARTVNLTVAACGTIAPSIIQVNHPQIPAEGFDVGERLSLSVVGNSPNIVCGLASDLVAQWTVVSTPIGSAVSLMTDGPLRASLLPDLEGTYTFSVSLLDRATGLMSAPSITSLEVGACGATEPVALVGSTAPSLIPPESSIALNAYTCKDSNFVQLDASASEDFNVAACGYAPGFNYQWSVQSLSPGLTVSISEPNREAVNLSVDGLEVNQRGSATLSVDVENLIGLSDRAEAHLEMTRLPSPSADSVTPDFFCVGERTVTLRGSDFLRIGTDLPSVEFGDRLFQASAVRGCVQIDQSNISRCNELDLTIPDGLESDLYALSVRNPYPLACADEGAPPTVLLISAPRIEQTAPRPICRGQFAGEITLSGAGFLREDGGASATTSVNGIVTDQTILEGCIIAGNQLSTCDSARFELPISQRDVKDLNIVVNNPPTSGCAAEDLRAEILLQQSEPPIINDVTPRKICDQGGKLTLLGDHFEANMTVELGPYRADQVISVNGEVEANAIWNRQEQARFIPGLYLVTARNQSGCQETFTEPVRVTEGPVPFFVDPPVVYSGISLQATAYLGNLFGGSVSKAEIQQGSNEPIELEFSADPAKPSLIKLIIPTGLPDGLYDLTLYDEVDCPGTTPALLRVTSDLSVTINELSPPFAWVNSSTSVTILSDPAAGFVPTPRSYLSPSTANECSQDVECASSLCRLGRCVAACLATSDCAQGDACVSGACVPQAAELRAASLNSVEELKGVVSSGFSPGEYDFIAVNPDGSVGLLERAIRVNPLPPPKISAVSPGSWEVNNAALPIQVSGDNFRAVTLSINCFDGGQTNVITPTITAETGELISLNIDTSNLSSTSICSLRLTNSDDAYTDFSPLTATNPSGNFVDFSLGQPLPQGEARRLSAVTYAQIPNGPPRLYVFGGDQGSDQQGLDDNLSIGINALGELETWGILPTILPQRMTRIEAHTIDRFIYILGGFNSDANAASDEVLRAEVLDPLYVPMIDQVDFEFDSNIAGLQTGIYYYRVAAIYGPNDPNNPNGESLPSEPQPVFIPDIPVGVRLVLTWVGLPDASGYRVYRSPSPDLLFGNEELVAELPATQFIWSDEGVEPLSNKRTLAIGELGEWHVAAHLNRAYTQHATAVAIDPVDPLTRHLYVFGGLADGVLSDDYEVLSIDLSVARSHQLAPPRLITNELSVARRQLKATSATPQEASGLPADKVFIYIFGGLESDNVDVAEVSPGGLLTSFNLTQGMQRSRQGYFATIANNNALSICGQGGSASSTAEKGVLCGVTGSGRNCGRPEYIEKWSSLGGTGAQACVNPGGAAARGFLYLIGGGDSNGSTSTKVDISLLGGTP